MKMGEIKQIVSAIIAFTIVIGFSQILASKGSMFIFGFFFAIIIIATNIAAKKLMASALDADVEHEIWRWSRYGFKPQAHLEKTLPAGLVFPLTLSFLSLGVVKILTFLTYETKALKHRAAKRFGVFSYTEITDWHNALIGAAGIISLLILSLIFYLIPFPNFEYLSILSTYYAFFNMLPISKLDGTQIFFGSRILWITLAIITTIFAGYALAISLGVI